MKVNLISILKNKTENQEAKDTIVAMKEKNKITYKIEDFKYIIKIISPNSLILNRNNKSIECTMYFEQSKVIPAIYTLKEEGYNIEINIKTNKIHIDNELIEIQYEVKDSNTSYEYHIEMSELK